MLPASCASFYLFPALALGNPSLKGGYLELKGNRTIRSFDAAKKRLTEIYRLNPKTFYCGCPFEKVSLSLKGCPYEPNNKRSRRGEKVEWDHLVPAAFIGKSLKGWHGDGACVRSSGKKFKGRECLSKVNQEAELILSDMYNLVPSEGEINGARGDRLFAELPETRKIFGTCGVKISKKRIEPPKNVRGDIARTFFYMNSAYPGFEIVSKENEALLKKWDKEDPADAWECEKAELIRKTQGNINPFIFSACGR